MKIIKLLIKYLVMYLSCLVPKNPRICVFGAWLGEQFADNPKYLFIEANQRKDLRPIWITKNPSVYHEVKSLGYEVYMFHSMKGNLCQLRAKYAFVCNGISDLNHKYLGRAVFVNMWHGVPLKKVGYDDTKVNHWDSKGARMHQRLRDIPLGNEHVIATSETLAKIYESAFRRPVSKIEVIGQPRTDIFYDEEQIFPRNEKLKKSLQDKKVILYAPTHRLEGKEEFPFDEHFDFQRLNEFCVKEDVIFIIRKHFYHMKEELDLSPYSNLFDWSHKRLDGQELLLYVDILITDYSSIYIDYLLLNRPILFYRFDYEDYLMEDREMYFDYEKVTPGIKAKNFDEFMEGLEEVVGGKDAYKEERKQVTKLFFGDVCKHAGERILNMMS